MKILTSIILFGTLFLLHGADASPASSDSGTVTNIETIVCIRHAEKPKGGLGQLTCRGLNRALALPDVLIKKFGAPQFIFAPNPTQKVDGKVGYYYVRPIVTIDPTAIRCGLPVNTEYGYKEIKGLESELDKEQYKNGLVFVAWEHALLDQFAKNLLKSSGGDPVQVPPWPGDEYDTIFVFRILRWEGHRSLAFTIDHENLNGLSDHWPENYKDASSLK